GAQLWPEAGVHHPALAIGLGPMAPRWLDPQQNGMVERVIRTLKEQCIHRHRFESIQHANRVIGDWISFYNHRRPHQALAMRTPVEAFRLAA
ncbi:integrase core domain-containing protein, partial [Rhodobacter capsulatus]|uniref:integrase core domain-containing protein n=2 Tax=Rhodobacter capsulatus TaxID=1061 RepID=UPI001EEF4771